MVLLTALQILVQKRLYVPNIKMIPLLEITVIFLPALAYSYIFHIPAAKLFHLGPVRNKAFVFTFFASVPLTLICIAVNALQGAQAEETPLVSYAADEKGALLFLGAVIFPAFCEELLFRGAVFTEFKPYHKAIAVAVSALTFAMLHANLKNFVAPLIAGVFYGVLVLLFDSVYPAVFAHFIYNSLIYLVYVYKDPLVSLLNYGAPVYIAAVVLFLLMLYGAVKVLESLLESKNRRDNREDWADTDANTGLIRGKTQGDPAKAWLLLVFAALWLIKILIPVFIK